MVQAGTKVNRVQKSITLPQDHIDRLAAESEERDLGESKLIERGLKLLWAKYDAQAKDE